MLLDHDSMAFDGVPIGLQLVGRPYDDEKVGDIFYTSNFLLTRADQ